jgi:hypothetical protein
MPPKKEVVVFIKIETLKLKEKIEELYIYQDNIKNKYKFYYNDELQFPFNLEKGFFRKFGKVKNFFDIIEDIKAIYSEKENLIKVVYYLKKGI